MDIWTDIKSVVDQETFSSTDPARTIEVSDDIHVIVTFRPDDRAGFDEINDCDCYGKVAWPKRDRYSGYEIRPDGFTGAARKLQTQWGDAYWWEPYREGHKVYDGDTDRTLVENMMNYGPYFVSVTLMKRDCCGHMHEIGFGSLGGLEPFPTDDDLKGFVMEVLDEVMHEARQATLKANA